MAPSNKNQSIYVTVCVEANRQEAMLDSESIMGTVFAVKKYSKKGICKCTHCNGDNHVVQTFLNSTPIQVGIQKGKLLKIPR